MASGPSCIDGRTIRSVAVSAAILRCRMKGGSVMTIRTETRGQRRATTSAANVQLSDQGLVTTLVGTSEVVEKLTPLGHKLEQPTPGVVVLDVALEVLGQIVDAFRQDRDLHFRRPGIAGFGRIGLDEFRFTRGRDRHRVSLDRKSVV